MSKKSRNKSKRSKLQSGTDSAAIHGKAKIGKKEYVILTRKRYEQLSRAEQDQVDAETARKGREAYLRGKIKPIPLEQARRKWGV